MSSRVSIIIPTYKRADRVEKAVLSALGQDYDDFEVIVVDDNGANTPEGKQTAAILNKYMTDNKIIYLQHNINKNGSAARNTGIKHSTGKYITFLDDDDEYYPHKIRVQAECLDKLDESWGLCYTGYEKIDQFDNLQLSSEKSEGNLLMQKNI